ncbi:MAG: 3,4-dihydroxy-2-butanone-4-phosphate synthase [Proteobacteria bacterium]|nr:3,4-dihydroxy-2-butanone-4-phosphate synthase [Cystobacterineae bacterium]MCL2314547.1 3,4-dihydroxy-2-butanone-4-phosphate synthase [Pseudomonadota bacterium]
MLLASDKKSIARVERAIEEIRQGRMVILTDDEDRENEGDLVMAAQKVTPAAINFMAKHGRGLICLPLTEKHIRQLRLPMMVSDNSSPFQTAFTVSIEAAKGVTTGISAADRAKTILTAVAPRAKPSDLVRPGHVFPLQAREGGVLVRTGQTEGSVDLARMAGLFPAGVLCEIMKDDGTMARRPDLLRFAKRHRLHMLSVADLIIYRLSREQFIRCIGQVALQKGPLGECVAYAFMADVQPEVHWAIVKGRLSSKLPILTRVHRADALGDLLEHAEGRGTLRQAFEAIGKEGRGVLLYLQGAQAPGPLRRSRLGAGRGGHSEGLREVGLGAQILRTLGIRRLHLLSHGIKRMVGLESYGLEIVRYSKLGEAPAPPRRPKQ